MNDWSIDRMSEDYRARRLDEAIRWRLVRDARPAEQRRPIGATLAGVWRRIRVHHASAVPMRGGDA